MTTVHIRQPHLVSRHAIATPRTLLPSRFPQPHGLFPTSPILPDQPDSFQPARFFPDTTQTLAYSTLFQPFQTLSDPPKSFSDPFRPSQALFMMAFHTAFQKSCLQKARHNVRKRRIPSQSPRMGRCHGQVYNDLPMTTPHFLRNVLASPKTSNTMGSPEDHKGPGSAWHVRNPVRTSRRKIGRNHVRCQETRCRGVGPSRAMAVRWEAEP